MYQSSYSAQFPTGEDMSHEHNKNSIRGVNDVKDSLTIEEKKAQWNMIMAERVLNCMFPEVDTQDATVINNRLTRKPKFTANELYSLAHDYFTDIYNKNSAGIRIIPDIEDFCLFINISRTAFIKLEGCNDIEIRRICATVRNAIAACKKQLALDGKIPPVVFAIDFNNNHDYVNNRSKVEISMDSQYEEVDESVNDILLRLPQDDEWLMKFKIYTVER